MQGKLLVAAVAASLLAGFSSEGVAGPGHKPGEGHDHAGEAAYGKPGDPKKPARIVQIVLREEDGKMLFLPNNLRSGKASRSASSSATTGRSITSSWWRRSRTT